MVFHLFVSVPGMFALLRLCMTRVHTSLVSQSLRKSSQLPQCVHNLSLKHWWLFEWKVGIALKVWDSEVAIHPGLRSGSCLCVMRHTQGWLRACCACTVANPCFNQGWRWQIQFGVITGAMEWFLSPSLKQCWCLGNMPYSNNRDWDSI